MTTLILAGRAIVAAADSVETVSDRYRADGIDYPFSANITGTVIVASLPGDFRTDRYEWDGTDLVRLPDPPAPPAPVPRVVTNFQARAALMQADLFDTVNTAVMGGTDALAKQAWEYANEITRDGALVNSLAAGLGLTAEQLDDLFRQAATIEA